jgi:hypothetical protein
MSVNPVDRWLRLVRRQARAAGIPLIVEHFLGGPSEESEPFQRLAYPQALLRALRTIASVEPDGIKEYYGLVPTHEDPNLRLTGLFLADPQISESEAMEKLAAPYGPCAAELIEFWRLASDAMELFPWNASWFIREIGRCSIEHSMSAAFIRGQQAHTPSWESTRRTVFMKTDSAQPDPWMLEDVQIQCELAAARMAEALKIGRCIRSRLPQSLSADFAGALSDLEGFRRRTLSYAYHIRETNLAGVMRNCRQRGEIVPKRVREELMSVLAADRKNQDQPEPCAAAMALLRRDADKSLATYFAEPEPNSADGLSKGMFTLTSR